MQVEGMQVCKYAGMQVESIRYKGKKSDTGGWIFEVLATTH